MILKYYIAAGGPDLFEFYHALLFCLFVFALMGALIIYSGPKKKE